MHTPSAGTVTMLMVKSDKRSKVFREQIVLLKEYSKEHNLPQVRHAPLGLWMVHSRLCSSSC